ncbi:MAG: phage holin family protein [Fulvivirga sp.]
MSILSSLLKKPLSVLEDKIAMAKAEVQNEVSAVLAKLLILLPILIFIFLALVIASAGIALLINHKLDHSYYGYLWVSGFYVVLAVFIILFSKTAAAQRILKRLSDKLVFGKE